jgi:DNA modification methylase
VSSVEKIPRPIHPFPARMAAAIPWNALRGKRKCLRVLDPMAGSGTTLVVARALRHRAIGFDTDPLAVLLAKVWCSEIDEVAVRKEVKKCEKQAGRSAKCMCLRKAYPINSDEDTRAFVRYWFDKTNRRRLRALADAIFRIRNAAVRDLLWCAFSRLIITKDLGASLARDVSHSRPHRALDKKPLRPLEHFSRAVNAILDARPFKSPFETRPAARIKKGDARHLPLKSRSVDIVISSPPYLNAIDYLRGHKLSLVWLGHELKRIRKLRATNIGTEVTDCKRFNEPVIAEALKRMGNLDKLPIRLKRMLGVYITDMDRVIREIKRVLVTKGKAVIVAGNCTVRGCYVRNSQALAYLGTRHGFKVSSLRRRNLPPNRRYLPPPSRSRSGPLFANRLRTEVILELSKR